MTFELPWPPTVNTYWRRVGNRTVLSAAGRDYKHTVAYVVLDQTRKKFGSSRIAVQIDAYPPDKRRRDLDNLPKGVLDALSDAGVFDDDSQIDDLHIVRHAVEKPGRLVMTITEAP